MEYNTYEDNITTDIADAINDFINNDDSIADAIRCENPQDNQLLIDTIFDMLDKGADITGGMNGSYFCNSANAKDFVLNAEDAFDILRHGINNQMITPRTVGEMFIDENWEALDVLIRDVDFALNGDYYIYEYLKTL